MNQFIRLTTFTAILLSVSSLMGEESVCRYCAEYQARAFGVELPGSGRRYAPIRHVDITHIRLDVTPDFERHSVRVKTLIKFIPLRKPLGQLVLDAEDLAIDQVTSSAAVAEHSSSLHQLTIQFVERLPVGKEAWVEISHECEPTGGFYFRTKAMGYKEEDTHCWTQGESHYARQWFPCFDYPNERSSTEVICHVPPKMTVLSNGKLLSEKVNEKTGLKAVHWLQEKPHVNYLICIVAGYLEKLEDKYQEIPLGFYTQPSLAKYAKNSFQDTAKIMEFFEQEIGVNYPWNKYDQVTILDFLAGGMENTTITTLTHRTLFADETENIRSSRSLDAHELAHQWFGDLVTCNDWSHLWLNEGFATFYTHLYEGHKYGNDHKLYGLYRDATGRILTNGNDKKPIVYNLYKNAGEQFDYRAYPKGSWVLHMLRCQLGEKLYQECIKTYLEKYQFKSVVTSDLQRTIEAKSGRTFDQFFDQWVFHARHPDLKVSYQWLPKEKLAKVTVAQTHKQDDDVLLFSLPTKIRFISKAGQIDHQLLVDQPSHDFFIPLESQPEIVRFDPEYTILGNITFDKPEQLLIAQLTNKDDMIGRILALKSLAKKKNNKSIQLIQKALNNDPFFGVRVEAAKALSRMKTEDSFNALSASLNQKDAKVRQEVVRGLSSHYLPEKREVLHQLLKTEKNPEVAAQAIRGLAKYSDEDSQKIMIGMLSQKSFGNERVEAAIAALSATGEAKHGPLLADLIQNQKMDFSDRAFAQLLESYARLNNHTKDKTGARNLLTQQLDDPRERVQLAAAKSLGILGDERSLSVLQALTTDDTGNKLSNEAKKAVEKLSQQVPISPKEVVDLRRTIDEISKKNKQLENSLNELKKKIEAK